MLTDKTIKDTVRTIVAKHKTNDPFTICKELNIQIINKDLGNNRGIFFYNRRKKMIFLNKYLQPELKRQICAHELGHSIMHKDISYFFMDSCTYLLTDKLEIQANKFAAELIIDTSDFINYSYYTVSQLASLYYVEEKIINYKIELSKIT